MTAWPVDGYALVDELRAHRDRLCLVTETEVTDVCLAALSELFGAPVTPVGREITKVHRSWSGDEVERYLTAATLLCDLDILFWRPGFDVDVLRLLRRLARNKPIVAAWPGEIVGDRAMYSRLGRRDSYEGKLADVIVLRPRPRRFPDQTPFDVEHIPA